MRRRHFRIKLAVVVIAACYALAYTTGSFIAASHDTMEERWREMNWETAELEKKQVPMEEKNGGLVGWAEEYFVGAKEIAQGTKTANGNEVAQGIDVNGNSVLGGEEAHNDKEIVDTNEDANRNEVVDVNEEANVKKEVDFKEEEEVNGNAVNDGDAVDDGKEPVNAEVVVADEKDASSKEDPDGKQVFSDNEDAKDNIVVNGKEALISNNNDQNNNNNNENVLIENTNDENINNENVLIENTNDENINKEDDNTNYIETDINETADLHDLEKALATTDDGQAPGQPGDQHIDQVNDQETLKTSPGEKEMLRQLNEGADNQPQNILSDKSLDKTPDELLREAQFDPEIEAIFHQVPDSRERRRMETN